MLVRNETHVLQLLAKRDGQFSESPLKDQEKTGSLPTTYSCSWDPLGLFCFQERNIPGKDGWKLRFMAGGRNDFGSNHFGQDGHLILQKEDYRALKVLDAW